MTDTTWVYIPGYAQKYRIYPSGKVERRLANRTWKEVAASGSPARVRLYRGPTEYRPYVYSLMKKVGWE